MPTVLDRIARDLAASPLVDGPVDDVLRATRASVLRQVPALQAWLGYHAELVERLIHDSAAAALASPDPPAAGALAFLYIERVLRLMRGDGPNPD